MLLRLLLSPKKGDRHINTYSRVVPHPWERGSSVPPGADIRDKKNNMR